MRSVFIHYPENVGDRVVQWLAENAEHKGEQWLYPSENNAVLYCSIANDLGDWEPEELTELQTKVPPPSMYLQIDVSGRVPGSDEVHKFVSKFLMHVSGSYAHDDYTPHMWDCDQIQKGYLVQEHPFFDYQGWYDEESG